METWPRVWGGLRAFTSFRVSGRPRRTKIIFGGSVLKDMVDPWIWKGIRQNPRSCAFRFKVCGFCIYIKMVQMVIKILWWYDEESMPMATVSKYSWVCNSTTVMKRSLALGAVSASQLETEWAPVGLDLQDIGYESILVRVFFKPGWRVSIGNADDYEYMSVLVRIGLSFIYGTLHVL